MSRKSFISQCIEGTALLDDIDDFIDRWHDIMPQVEELHDYLGMNWEEYSMWVADPDILPYIVTAHKDSVDLESLLEEHYYALPLAARAGNALTAKKVMAWLKAHGKLDD